MGTQAIRNTRGSGISTKKLLLIQSTQSQANMTEEKIRNFVDAYREVYDKVVAEDKMLDRSFKRDFSDIPLSLVDQLYKLFKRRPR